MILENHIWDILLIMAAAYVAIASLVSMMKAYRQDLVINMRAIVLERRQAKRAAMARRQKVRDDAEAKS